VFRRARIVSEPISDYRKWVLVDLYSTTDRGAMELGWTSFEEVWKLSILMASTGRISPARQAREAPDVRLREIRKEAGLMGRALAVGIGCHCTKISRIENGGQAPPEENIIPGLFQTAEYSAATLSYFIDFLDAPNDLDAAEQHQEVSVFLI
jgi:hypothetical protein